jgi:hypothetical protein
MQSSLESNMRGYSPSRELAMSKPRVAALAEIRCKNSENDEKSTASEPV